MAVVIEADDAFVAEAAVEALGKIGAPEAIAVLEQAQEQGTVRVRWAAHRALDQIKSSRQQRLKVVPRRCG
jgi:HEAT repeat protein